MNNQPKPLLVKDFLGQILSTIQYPIEDRLAFIEKFILTCHQHTVVSLVNKVAEKDASISQAFEEVSSQEHMTAFLKHHFSKDEYALAFNDITLNLLQQYIQTLAPKLTKQQLNQIKDYIQHPLNTMDVTSSFLA